jgi:two-component system LytT family sensor kinase
MPGSATNSFFSGFRANHLILWGLLLVVLFRHNTVMTPGMTAWLIAILGTGFAFLTFYISSLYFTPLLYGKKKPFPFLANAILFTFVVSFLGAIVELAIYRILFGDSGRWYFMGLFWTTLFFIAFFLMLGTTFGLVRTSHAERRKMEEIRRERLSFELSSLKSQLHPHFLFNVQNTIYFLINEDPALAAKLMLRLSAIMRYQLYECQAEWVVLEKELEHIANYIELEKIRLGTRVAVSYSVVGAPATVRIVPFILIPLIENAFKHVSRHAAQPNFIRIEASINGGRFCFRVANTFERNPAEAGARAERNPADRPPSADLPKGIGLPNLRRRLDLMYGNQFEMSTTAEGGLFVAQLNLQLI